jgi:hypothetical protein
MNSDMLFVVHDAFQSIYTWQYIASSSDNANAILDTHHYEGEQHSIVTYEVFGTNFVFQGQLTDVCQFGTTLSNNEGKILTVVGEFSGAQTDCRPLWNQN